MVVLPFYPRAAGRIGALVTVMCLAAVWGYRSTKQLREMRKKLSDDARGAPALSPLPLSHKAVSSIFKDFFLIFIR